MLPARNVTSLRKHYAIISKPKAAPIKKPSPPVSANPSPVTAAAASLQAVAAATEATTGAVTATTATATSAAISKPASNRASPVASTSSPAPSESVDVDYRSTNRSGGDTRIKLSKPLPAPPPGFTALKAHKLASLDGIKFFHTAEVMDPDDASNIYVFDLDDPTHCACFNIGQSDVVDDDGQASPVIGWNDLYVLYQLPDGSKWAEHGSFYDCEDLVKHARGLKRKHQEIIPKDTTDRELFKKAGRSHSRLQNIEFECWVFKDSLPTEARLTELGIEKDNAYYSRITFDPKTLDKRL
ncbi:hypothetical protein ABBQ32_007083 [Trebouxia sp. C0010 RCD-2024]